MRRGPVRAVVTRVAIRRPPTPPGPRRGARHGQGRGRRSPGPRPSSNSFPSCRAEASQARRQRRCPNCDRSKCNTREARATDARRTHGAAGRPCRTRLVLYFRTKSLRPAAWTAGRRGRSVEISPAAGRLAGDMLLKALIHEFAERPAQPRPDEIRHRAAGAAQRGPDAGARARAATPTTSSCRAKPMRRWCAAASPTA